MTHKIYCLEVKECRGWDTYLGFVVIADSEDEAGLLCEKKDRDGSWHNAPDVTCKHIGESDCEKGVIMDSFNAG